MPLIFTNIYNHIDMDRKPSSVVRNQCQHVIIIYMHCFLSVLITIYQQNEIVIAISQQNEILIAISQQNEIVAISKQYEIA